MNYKVIQKSEVWLEIKIHSGLQQFMTGRVKSVKENLKI